MAHEIHENDHMMAVGEQPWHGLGTTIATPPESGEEALRIAKLDWDVVREPLFLGSGQRATISGAANRQNDGQHAATVRKNQDGTTDILGVVGPAFTPYQNADMAKLFNPLIQDGIADIETCGSLFNGRRVWMLAKFKGGNLKIDSNDEVARYLMAAHGHDGCFAMRFGPTATRIVCNNTLSMAVESEETSAIKLLHTKNLAENLEILRDAVVKTQEHFELTADQFRLLANRGVSRADLREFARIIVAAKVDEKDWTSGQRKKIGVIIGAAVEGRGNSGKNWWHAYNGVTEYLTWERHQTVDARMESLWFGDSSKVNEKALNLALEMSA